MAAHFASQFIPHSFVSKYTAKAKAKVYNTPTLSSFYNPDHGVLTSSWLPIINENTEAPLASPQPGQTRCCFLNHTIFPNHLGSHSGALYVSTGFFFLTS
jgi:hypothetical protein